MQTKASDLVHLMRLKHVYIQHIKCKSFVSCHSMRNKEVYINDIMFQTIAKFTLQKQMVHPLEAWFKLQD